MAFSKHFGELADVGVADAEGYLGNVEPGGLKQFGGMVEAQVKIVSVNGLGSGFLEQGFKLGGTYATMFGNLVDGKNGAFDVSFHIA